MQFTRAVLAGLIHERLAPHAETYRREFTIPGRVQSFYVDNLLPQDVALAIFEAFPHLDRMIRRRNWREDKFIGVQMNQYERLIEESVFAFQDESVVNLIGEVTGLSALEPDPRLYAGGISSMVRGQFLSPHVDNSHDGERLRYRALNLLYYVSPDWEDADGGHLELWDHGMGHPQRTIHSRFNRLIVMQTDRRSIHSVSPIAKDARRCCVSNYYFSIPSPMGMPYFHATSFRAWPGHPVRDLVLRADAKARTILLNTILRNHYKNPHVYRR